MRLVFVIFKIPSPKKITVKNIGWEKQKKAKSCIPWDNISQVTEKRENGGGKWHRLVKKIDKQLERTTWPGECPASTQSCAISCLSESQESWKSTTTPGAPECAPSILKSKEPSWLVYGCCMGRTSWLEDQCLLLVYLPWAFSQPRLNYSELLGFSMAQDTHNPFKRRWGPRHRVEPKDYGRRKPLSVL